MREVAYSRIDVKANNSLALRLALLEGNSECVALLLGVSDAISVDESRRGFEELARENGREGIALLVKAFNEACELSRSLAEGAMDSAQGELRGPAFRL